MTARDLIPFQAPAPTGTCVARIMVGGSVVKTVVMRSWADQVQPTCGGLCHPRHGCSFTGGACLVIVPGFVSDAAAVTLKRP